MTTDAVDKVATGRRTAYSAAKKYDIPRQTLERHIHRPGVGSVGRPSALSVAQKLRLWRHVRSSRNGGLVSLRWTLSVL